MRTWFTVIALLVATAASAQTYGWHANAASYGTTSAWLQRHILVSPPHVVVHDKANYRSKQIGVAGLTPLQQWVYIAHENYGEYYP